MYAFIWVRAFLFQLGAFAKRHFPFCDEPVNFPTKENLRLIIGLYKSIINVKESWENFLYQFDETHHTGESLGRTKSLRKVARRRAEMRHHLSRAEAFRYVTDPGLVHPKLVIIINLASKIHEEISNELEDFGIEIGI